MKKLLLLLTTLFYFLFPKPKKKFNFTFDIDTFSTKNSEGKKVNQANEKKYVKDISLPNFNGEYKRFLVKEVSNLSPELQAEFPNIKSYEGITSDGASKVAISISPELGMKAVILAAEGVSYIEALSNRPSRFQSSSKGESTLKCTTPSPAKIAELLEDETKDSKTNRSAAENGNIKQYRLALTCDYQYAAKFGGTASGVLAAYNATMTTVNAIFQRDTGVRMVLVPETIALMNLRSTDVSFYPGNINLKVQDFFTTKLGNNNYDIGHAFLGAVSGGNAGYAGNAMINPTPTQPYGKGSGYTGDVRAPFGIAFDIDYVTHEMGHQFGAYHTFSYRCEGHYAQCEPGSGNTAMGYANIAGADNNIQTYTDGYFHGISQLQITTYCKARGATVLPLIPTGNRSPIVNAGVDLTIPKGTMIYCEGTYSDSDTNDTLTHCWETFNSGCGAGEPKADGLQGPKFKSNPPGNSNIRILGLKSVLDGVKYKWETLPYPTKYTNEVLQMVIRMGYTVRDNKGEYGQDQVMFKVSNLAAPFKVTSQPIAATFEVGSTQTITWDKGGTRENGINCTKVDILLSTDGGYTYPTKLAIGVENDGEFSVIIPNNIGSKNRFMVKGTNHVFCDINKSNFTIKAKTIPPPVVDPPVFDDDVDDEGTTNAPLNFNITNITRTGCKLNWNVNPNFTAISYSIYQGTEELPIIDNNLLAGHSTERYKGTTTGLSYTASGLTSGKQYHFVVKGKSSTGVRSKKSETIYIKTLK